MAEDRTAGGSAKVAIYASIVANLAIAATKFTAAAFTGSSAMVAEGLHSLVDSCDGTLILVGQRRSRRMPDRTHPFGHGQELYFWTLIVAILFFALGGGMSVYEGIQHILHPEPLRDPAWSYAVLGVAALIDGTSFTIAYRSFRRRMRGRGFWETVRASKDPSLFTIVLEDSADLIGLALAFLGIFLGHRLGTPYLDGAASIAIGLLLAGVAVVLIGQSRELLIGESADPVVVAAIEEAAAAEPGVVAVRGIRTLHFGPHEMLVAVCAEFASHLTAEDVARVVDGMGRRVRRAVPDVVTHVYVEPELPRADDGTALARSARLRGGAPPPAAGHGAGGRDMVDRP
jgi:cation diffusion facilitator family transporter